MYMSLNKTTNLDKTIATLYLICTKQANYKERATGYEVASTLLMIDHLTLL